MNLKFLFLGLGAFFTFSSAYAAVSIDTSRVKPETLKEYFAGSGYRSINMELKNEHTDFKGTNHVRFQEKYQGYSVWGADLIVHVPKEAQTTPGQFDFEDLSNKNTFMNGTIYIELDKDLPPAPFNVDSNQLENAFSKAEKNYGKMLSDKKSELIVYVDHNNKAHWAFKISYSTVGRGGLPSRPTVIIDVNTLEIYLQWDDIQTTEDVSGGGYGGNPRMGKITYDGGPNHYAALKITKDDRASTCYIKNSDINIYNLNTRKVTEFYCNVVDPNHNNTYWDNSLDQANQGYSPSNDAFFGLTMVKDLYKNWYGIPVLTQNGQPMVLVGVVHYQVDNAYWDGSRMIFGDGVSNFYPLTSLDVIGHEVSHGFTQQHSNLVYEGQSGGLNESYSDMAGEANKFFVRGTNNWLVGSDIMKNCNGSQCALRYMFNPPLDGHSIDNANQYRDGMNVHYSSGVYNKAYYLLAIAADWNIKKAFDVMVKANMDYWTSTSNFQSAACGVIHATKDYGYDLQGVLSALSQVGVDVSQCV